MKALSWTLAALAAGLYANTLWNGYVLDDRLVITEHHYVKQGARGIPTILTTDAFVSMYEDSGTKNKMQGGRYRPLSQLTFALEVEAAGQPVTNLTFSPAKLGEARRLQSGERLAPPWVGHLGNVLLFTLVAMAGYAALRRLLPDEPWAAFLGMLLFVAHPLNTEVVANIKSRDELLSLLFMLLVVRLAFRRVALACLCALLAAFSKEYALTLLVLIPILGWIERPGRRRFAWQVAGIALVLAVYLAVRLKYVPFRMETSLDPSMDAYVLVRDQPWVALASKLRSLGVYLKLMVWPHPLVYSYAHEHLPFVGPGSPWVWLSVTVYGATAAAAWVLTRRRSPLGFLLFFALGTLFMVSNLAFSAANVVAERLAFHATWALAALVGWALQRWGGPARYAFGAVVLLGLGVLTVRRNAEWRDMETLYVADGDRAPDCCLIQCNAGAIWLDRFYRARRAGAPATEQEALLDRAHVHTVNALTAFNYDAVAHINMARIRIERGELDLAHDSLSVVAQLQGHNEGLPPLVRKLGERFFERGLRTWAAVKEGRFEPNEIEGAQHRAQLDLDRATRLVPDNTEAWYYLHGGYIEIGDEKRAERARERIGDRAWKGFE